MRRLSQNKSIFATFCLHTLGILFCILPPAICTLSYFPLWKNNSEKTLAGGVLILLLICAHPLFKLMKKAHSSPTSITVWLVIFIAFLLLSKIADEMTVISFFGVTGNLVGSVLFAVCKKLRKETGDEK